MTPLKCPGQDARFIRADDIAEVQCPQCGQAVEFWPDELMRKCSGCGRRLANPQNSMKCLEWCDYAAQCLEAIGSEGGIGPLREELVERMREAFDADTAKIEREAITEAGRQVGLGRLS